MITLPNDKHEIVKAVCAGIDFPIVFELGAHKGEDTFLLSQIPNVEVHAFECDYRNKMRNKPDNVIWNDVCISDRKGTSVMYLSNHISGHEWAASSSLKVPKKHLSAHPQIEFRKSSQVQTTSLDIYCEERGIEKIDFIWSDLQGAEDLFLAGAKRMLPNIKAIMLEYYSEEMYAGQMDIEDIDSMLGDDWTPAKIFDFDVVFINRKFFEA